MKKQDSAERIELFLNNEMHMMNIDTDYLNKTLDSIIKKGL